MRSADHMIINCRSAFLQAPWLAQQSAPMQPCTISRRAYLDMFLHCPKAKRCKIIKGEQIKFIAMSTYTAMVMARKVGSYVVLLQKRLQTVNQHGSGTMLAAVRLAVKGAPSKKDEGRRENRKKNSGDMGTNMDQTG